MADMKCVYAIYLHGRLARSFVVFAHIESHKSDAVIGIAGAAFVCILFIHLGLQFQRKLIIIVFCWLFQVLWLSMLCLEFHFLVCVCLILRCCFCYLLCVPRHRYRLHLRSVPSAALMRTNNQHLQTFLWSAVSIKEK